MQRIVSYPPIVESTRPDQCIEPLVVRSTQQQRFAMLLDHFGLREDPFGSTPDPRFLYLTAKHREALASLESGIQCNHGFLVLVAPPGLGKTTLLYHMLERYKSSCRANTAFILQTQCNPRELVRQIVTDFGLTSVDQDLVQMYQQLNEFLARQVNSGRQVILFIDEAQDLRKDVLEAVRLLSNFETPRSKLLQIVLSGQPGLSTRLASSRLLQLRQRVFTTIRLEPLDQDEADGYIDHRLTVAGYNSNGLFTPKAREIIIQQSEGVPRVINSLCFSCLVLGHTLNADKIDASIVERVVQNLPPRTPFEAWAHDPPNAELAEAESRAMFKEEEEVFINSAAPPQTPPPLRMVGEPKGSRNPRYEPAAPSPEFPQLIRSVKVRAKVPMKQLPEVLRAIHAAESELDGRGHVDVQYADSGQLARVTIEGESDEVAKKHIDAIAKILQSNIGA